MIQTRDKFREFAIGDFVTALSSFKYVEMKTFIESVLDGINMLIKSVKSEHVGLFG